MPIWHFATRVPRDPSPPAAQGSDVPPTTEMVKAFFPLMYSTVPMSGGRLVRLEVPHQTATAFGVEVPEASASGVVLADVLVGDDGIARAVRFVRPVITVEKERQR